MAYAGSKLKLNQAPRCVSPEIKVSDCSNLFKPAREKSTALICPTVRCIDGAKAPADFANNLQWCRLGHHSRRPCAKTLQQLAHTGHDTENRETGSGGISRPLTSTSQAKRNTTFFQCMENRLFGPAFPRCLRRAWARKAIFEQVACLLSKRMVKQASLHLRLRPRSLQVSDHPSAWEHRAKRPTHPSLLTWLTFTCRPCAPEYFSRQS